MVLSKYSRSCDAKPVASTSHAAFAVHASLPLATGACTGTLCCSKHMLTDILPPSQPPPSPSSPPLRRPSPFTTSCPEHHPSPSTTVLVAAHIQLHHPRRQALVLPPLQLHTFFAMQSSLHQYFPATKAGVCRPAKDDEYTRAVAADTDVEQYKPNPFDILPIEVCRSRCTCENFNDETVPRR